MIEKKSYAWRIGEILIQNGWITWDQLEQALQIQRNPEAIMGRVLVKKGFLNQSQGDVLFLGEILIRNGWISWEHLAEALEIQQEDGRMLGEILLDKGFVEKRNLYGALAIQAKMPFVNLKELTVPHEVIESVSKKIVYENHVLPLMKRNNIFLVAISNPKDLRAGEVLKEIARDHEIRYALACPEDLDEAIRRYYGIES